jgi:hypothetical protein
MIDDYSKLVTLLQSISLILLFTRREIHGQVDDIARRLKNIGMSIDQSRLENEDMCADRGLLLKVINSYWLI